MPEIADLLEMVLNPSLPFILVHAWLLNFLPLLLHGGLCRLYRKYTPFPVEPKSREDVNLDSPIRQFRWSTAVASPLARILPRGPYSQIAQDKLTPRSGQKPSNTYSLHERRFA